MPSQWWLNSSKCSLSSPWGWCRCRFASDSQTCRTECCASQISFHWHIVHWAYEPRYFSVETTRFFYFYFRIFEGKWQTLHSNQSAPVFFFLSTFIESISIKFIAVSASMKYFRLAKRNFFELWYFFLVFCKREM